MPKLIALVIFSFLSLNAYAGDTLADIRKEKREQSQELVDKNYNKSKYVKPDQNPEEAHEYKWTVHGYKYDDKD